MKLFASFLFQSTIGIPNDSKIASRPKFYKRPIQALKYDFSGQQANLEKPTESPKRIAPQRFSSEDFEMMTEDVSYKIFPSTSNFLKFLSLIGAPKSFFFEFFFRCEY